MDIGKRVRLWFKAVAGTTYRISADDPDGGTVALVWEHVSPPPNDDLANAAVVPWTASGTTSGSNHTASLEVGEPAHAAPGGRSVWWTTTSAATGYATLNTSGSNFDTTLAVYTGTSIAGLVPVGSNDDSNGTVQSEVRFLATAGTTYRIAVDGFQGKTGEITLNWSFPTRPLPARRRVCRLRQATRPDHLVQPTRLRRRLPHHHLHRDLHRPDKPPAPPPQPAHR